MYRPTAQLTHSRDTCHRDVVRSTDEYVQYARRNCRRILMNCKLTWIPLKQRERGSTTQEDREAGAPGDPTAPGREAGVQGDLTAPGRGAGARREPLHPTELGRGDLVGVTTPFVGRSSPEETPDYNAEVSSLMRVREMTWSCSQKSRRRQSIY